MHPLILGALALGAAPILAHPHRHHHGHLRHIAKRGVGPAAIYQPAPVVTVVVYVLNGKPISEDEVRQGIANGTLLWGDDGKLSTSPTATPTPVPIMVSEEAPVATPADKPRLSSSSQPDQAATSSAQPGAQPAPSGPANPAIEAPQTIEQPKEQPHEHQDVVDGLDREFPNGVYSCDSFPLGYGATPVDHAGLGGWIGIQDPGFTGDAGYDDIMTVPHGTCSDGSCCTPGSFCSYSCPPGRLKSSWPEKQGARKQSVGGLYCNENGKLEMASGSIAKTLCVKGTDKVTIKVKNNLSVSESICRTDYPGTESETIPITTHAGGSAELACPDNGKYYKWDGKPTSAQYYINPKGTPENEACQWGDGSKSIGNWAPVNLGVGFDSASQKAYISLFPNAPTNPDGKLDFVVELVADQMSGRCKYSKGMYYFGDNYSESSPTKGCTIALDSGELNVVLSDD